MKEVKRAGNVIIILKMVLTLHEHMHAHTPPPPPKGSVESLRVPRPHFENCWVEFLHLSQGKELVFYYKRDGKPLEEFK